MQKTITIMIFIISTTLLSQNPKVLFIKGGSGTGGFLEGGADEQLSDIADYSTRNKNHGWGQFADILRTEGFELEQKTEGPKNNNAPVDIIHIDLNQYGVIVFGSNNANYSKQAVDSLWSFVRNGGGVLFISDANWGQNWGDAPTSDQAFLSTIGWEMNQDQGTYTLYKSDFKDKNHYILQNVMSFDGEGVSPITLKNSNITNVTSTILAPAKNNVRRNTGMGQGPSQPPNSKDASLIIAEFGKGRVAGHFDRNTFFNTNGAGSNIHKNNNKTYAINLYKWLAGMHLPSGIDDALAQNSHMVQNPAKGAIYFKALINTNHLSIFDAQGKQVFFDYTGDYTQKVVPQTQHSGILILKIITKNTMVTEKVLFHP